MPILGMRPCTNNTSVFLILVTAPPPFGEAMFPF